MKKIKDSVIKMFLTIKVKEKVTELKRESENMWRAQVITRNHHNLNMAVLEGAGDFLVQIGVVDWTRALEDLFNLYILTVGSIALEEDDEKIDQKLTALFRYWAGKHIDLGMVDGHLETICRLVDEIREGSCNNRNNLRLVDTSRTNNLD